MYTEVGWNQWQEVDDCMSKMGAIDKARLQSTRGSDSKREYMEIECDCCQSYGEHDISKGPDRLNYSCVPCCGFGGFPIMDMKGLTISVDD
tara:strand:+ start:3706 stop:3978 length:273 start_codon:yes stop_codon:yes gene_type:complete